MTTFAELHKEVVALREQIQVSEQLRAKAVEMYQDSKKEIDEMEKRLLLRATTITQLEDTLAQRDHEVLSLRDEFMKSIFIARTTKANTVEEAYDYTVDAVAYLMGTKTREKQPPSSGMPPDLRPLDRPTRKKKTDGFDRP